MFLLLIILGIKEKDWLVFREKSSNEIMFLGLDDVFLVYFFEDDGR